MVKIKKNISFYRMGIRKNDFCMLLYTNEKNQEAFFKKTGQIE